MSDDDMHGYIEGMVYVLGPCGGGCRHPEHRMDEPDASPALEAKLAEYARRIEQHWRGLSDGERLRLMELCCKGCGAVEHKLDGSPRQRCYCGPEFDR